MRADPRVGTVLAGHRVEAIIGRGGMAVVYRAEHLRLGRKVALKVLDPELAEDEAFRERFIRESRIAGGLDHPNIVTVYDAGEAEGVLYISMRHVEGSDLERTLRDEGRLEPARAVSIVSQSAAALDAAHAKGLVHRDVKPANILLAAGHPPAAERVYLSDFGITKRVRTDAAITRTGTFVGTVDYVAPEQIRGEEVDGRADVYSLGCVLYRCLAGDVPFPRETEVATIYAHLQEDAPAPSERSPELPVAVDEVVARALAKAREQRYQTCAALAEDAGKAIDSRPPTYAVAAANHVEAPASGRRADERHVVVRRRIALVVTGLAGFALVAVTSILLLFSNDRLPGNDEARDRPSPSAAPTPAGVATLRWRTVPDPKGVFLGRRDQNIARAVSMNGVIIAVGRDDSGSDLDAAVWRSSDATRWVRVDDDQLGGAGDQQMAGATVFDSEVAAVGWDEFGGQTDAAVWTSETRGRHWERIKDARLTEEGDQTMRRVVSTDMGLVAVGSETTTAADGLDAAVWASENGHQWSRMPSQYFVGKGDEEAFGVATFDGRLVVVGYRASESGNQDAAVWVRSDSAWLPVDDPASFGGDGDQQMTTVIAAGPGLVAVGFDTAPGSHDAAVWTSTDGLVWDRIRAEEVFGGPGDEQMFALAETGSLIVAGGVSEPPERGEADAAIWLSRDLLDWRRVRSSTRAAVALGGLGRQQIKTLVVFGDRLVAAGSTSRTRDDGAAVWTARLPSP